MPVDSKMLSYDRFSSKHESEMIRILHLIFLSFILSSKNLIIFPDFLAYSCSGSIKFDVS